MKAIYEKLNQEEKLSSQEDKEAHPNLYLIAHEDEKKKKKKKQNKKKAMIMGGKALKRKVRKKNKKLKNYA